MSYKLESLSDCKKKIVFTFATLDLSTEIKASVVEKQKSANLKGFRKGKAPLTMVEKMFGPQIETDALNRFVQAQVFQAIQKESLRVVGYPNFENMKYDSGKSVSFDALVETFPVVAVKPFTGYSFKKEKAEVTAEDVDRLKKNYLNSRSEMTEVKDASIKLAKGHFATLNFAGEKENGERPENMAAQEFVLEIGSNQFIPGFEDGMIGMKKGDKKVIAVTFPADYHMDDLKNSKVKFDVELLEIKEKKLPDLTDEMAKEFGFDSAADFETKNKANLVQQKERAAKEKLHQELLEKLVADNKFEVPTTLIMQQEEHVREDLKKTLTHQGFNEQMMAEYFVKWHADVTKKAEFQVRSGLILDKLANDYKVEATEADFIVKIEEAAKMSNMPADQVKKYYTSNESIKKNLMYAIREEKTFSKILDQVKLT
jgi:trigger factor